MAMMSDSRIPITVFSIFSEWYRLAFSLVQSLIRYRPCPRRFSARSRATAQDWSMSCSLRRTPVTPSPMRSTRCRSAMLATARPLSISL